MSRLLYIESSPRKQRSHSGRVARAFLAAHALAHPECQVERIDLWNYPLPEITKETLDAKYAILSGIPHTEAQMRAWEEVRRVFRQFAAAEEYLFSLPMWNFSIPYKLKHYIDVITQPELSFRFTLGRGYEGLVSGRPATVIYARGGAYPRDTPDEGYDQQRRYLEQWLRFIGFSEIQTVVVEPTLADHAAVENTLTAAIHQATQLVRLSDGARRSATREQPLRSSLLHRPVGSSDIPPGRRRSSA